MLVEGRSPQPSQHIPFFLMTTEYTDNTDKIAKNSEFSAHSVVGKLMVINGH